MFTKKGKKFEAWSENGRYFYRPSRFAMKKEISQEQFREILANETITAIGFTQNESLGIHELFEHAKKHNKEKTSEFGKRVKVVIVEAEQKDSVDVGVDVYFKLDVLNEETNKMDDDLFSITTKIKDVSGPLTDRGVYYPEVYRSLFQLAFNGYLASDEEVIITKEALKWE